MFFIICFIITAICFISCLVSINNVRKLKTPYYTPRLGGMIFGAVVVGALMAFNFTLMITYGFN